MSVNTRWPPCELPCLQTVRIPKGLGIWFLIKRAYQLWNACISLHSWLNIQGMCIWFWLGRQGEPLMYFRRLWERLFRALVSGMHFLPSSACGIVLCLYSAGWVTLFVVCLAFCSCILEKGDWAALVIWHAANAFLELLRTARGARRRVFQLNEKEIAQIPSCVSWSICSFNTY